MEKKLRVRIRAIQQVCYDQTVQMTQAEYDELINRRDNDPRFGQLGDDDIGWLDLRDCDSDGDLEDIEIEIVEPADSGSNEP